MWDTVFSADSLYLVTASSDQSAKLWDLRNGTCLRNYVGHNLAVTCVCLNDSIAPQVPVQVTAPATVPVPVPISVPTATMPVVPLPIPSQQQEQQQQQQQQSTPLPPP